VVASFTFIVLVMLAPRRFDKFTLRLLPVLLDKGDWRRCARLSAFWRMAHRVQRGVPGGRRGPVGRFRGRLAGADAACADRQLRVRSDRRLRSPLSGSVDRARTRPRRHRDFPARGFGLTRELLTLFRPEFADEGIVALRLLALTAAFVVLVAMAPTYLKYRAQHRVIYASAAAAACVQVVLLLLLVPRMGATGAAWAYAIAMGGLYGNLARVARRELRQMRIHGAPQTG
jgi:Polysaccharide biosynthesis C-terminal domain